MAHQKLVLVNPVNPARIGLTINEGSRFPPLGLGIVAALTPPSWEITLIDENWEPFTYQDADLVGITAFTPPLIGLTRLPHSIESETCRSLEAVLKMSLCYSSQ
jgi:hypothetical protein